MTYPTQTHPQQKESFYMKFKYYSGKNRNSIKKKVRIMETQPDEEPAKPINLDKNNSMLGKTRKILKFSNKNLNARDILKSQKHLKLGFQGSKIKTSSYSPSKIRNNKKVFSNPVEKNFYQHRNTNKIIKDMQGKILCYTGTSQCKIICDKYINLVLV